MNTVSTPSVLQHLSLPQKSGSSTPIMFPKVQDAVELKVKEPVVQGKQPTSNPEPATGIDGLQGVVNKLSQEQQSLTMNRKILVPVKVPQAEVILLQSGSFLPKPVKLGNTGSVSNPISHVPSTFSSSVISRTQLGTSRSPVGTTPTTTSGMPSTQSLPAGGTHSSSPGLQLILGRVSGINASFLKASQGKSTHLQKSNVNTSTSSQTTFVMPRISGGVQSTTSSLSLKIAPQTGGTMPLTSTVQYVPTSSPLTGHSVPVSTPGRLLSISSQTAPISSLCRSDISATTCTRKPIYTYVPQFP